MINTNDDLYEYVHLVANECAPEYDCFDGENIEQVESIVGHDFLRMLDSGKLKFRFTKENYLDNYSIIETLMAYNIDIEKFWYAMLFIDHFTETKFINAFLMEDSALSQLESFAQLLSNENSRLSVNFGKREKQTITYRRLLNTIVNMMNEMCKANENNTEFTAQPINLSDKSRVTRSTSLQVAFITERYLKLFEKLDIDKTKKANVSPTISLNKKFLISRILYFTKMVRNKSYLYDDATLRGILKTYKDAKIDTISNKYLR